MAKVKKVSESDIMPAEKEVTNEEKIRAIDALSKALNRSGLGVVGRIGTNEELDNRLKIKFFPTASREFNKATGGGIPEGKVSVVSGPEDSGKTSLILETIKVNQELNAGFWVLWVETESSISTECLDMFNIDKSRIIFLPVSKVNTGEKIIDMVKTYVAQGYINMVVINTLKMLIPESETNKKMSEISVAAQARMNSRIMQQLVSLIDEKRCAVVIIQQLTTNIGQMYGNPLMLAGGRAIRYAAMLITEQNKVKPEKGDPVTPETGLKFNVRVKKNHCIWGRNPYVTTSYCIEYGKGTEQVASTLNSLVEAGILEAKGAWIRRYNDNGEEMQDYKWNGKAAFKKDMEENPEKLQTLLDILDSSDVSTVKVMSEEEIEAVEKENTADEDFISTVLTAEEKEEIPFA